MVLMVLAMMVLVTLAMIVLMRWHNGRNVVLKYEFRYQVNNERINKTMFVTVDLLTTETQSRFVVHTKRLSVLYQTLQVTELFNYS